MIEVKNIEKVYGEGKVKTRALRGISFNIGAGEFVAIMGPSGSGKSTLMHIIGLLDRPTRGTYLFEGENVDNFSDEKLARLRNKKMGFVFQTFNLLPRVNVFENVRLPLVYSRLSQKAQKERVLASIEAVDLSDRIHHNPNQLSGGEQQRVAIARALVNNPTVIFADEPTGNLDSGSGKAIMKILQDLNGKGHTVILVTHEKYTSEHAQRIISLMDGSVVGDGKVAHRIYAKDHDDLLK